MREDRPVGTRGCGFLRVGVDLSTTRRPSMLLPGLTDVMTGYVVVSRAALSNYWNRFVWEIGRDAKRPLKGLHSPL